MFIIEVEQHTATRMTMREIRCHSRDLALAHVTALLVNHPTATVVEPARELYPGAAGYTFRVEIRE